MKTLMMKIALIGAIIWSVALKADDHLFTLPLLGNDIEVGQAWYYEDGGYHGAIDYTRTVPGAIAGQEILAVYGGVVEHVTNNIPNGTNPAGHSYGNYIKIDHGNGYETLYAHCMENSIPLDVGDYVQQGQVIGQVGLTGNTTGYHLHFESYYQGERIDPYGWYNYASTPNTYPNCNPDEYYWTSNPPLGPPNVSSERQLPDDLLVHVLGSPDYYWFQDGLMCGFDSEYPFYTWGLEWDEAVEITPAEFSNFSIGPNIKVMLGAGVFDENGQRWLFDYASDTSPTIVKRKATNWEELSYASDIWIPVSNAFMMQFNEGPELLTSNDYPYGAVLENENNSAERYVLVKGDDYGFSGQKVKLPLFSNDVYNINYYHYNFNVPVSSSILNNYPSVTTQLLVRDGKLISGSGSEIYYLENGYKRHIVDAITFAYYGFDYAQVHQVSDDLINAFPTGADLLFNPSGGADAYAGGELEDGGFDSGLASYWTFSDWQQGADFQVTSGNSVAGIYKSEANIYSAANYYDVEIKQLVNVEANAMYHCSFYLRSDDPMTVKFNLGRDTSPWDNYGLWKEIDTQSDWHKYQYIFNCSDSDPLARLAFQIGETSGHLYLDQVVFEKITDIDSPADNLLANADFELGHYAPWQVEDHNGNAEYYTDDSEPYDGEYAMFIKPHQSGDPQETQLRQTINVQSGETYYVSFYARAIADRNIILETCHDGSPWNNYGLWEEISIGSEWSLYTTQFTANNSGNPRFAMYFGQQDIGVWVDDLSISSTASADNQIITNPLQISLSQNYPNPFNPQTCIAYQVPDASSKLCIYNLKGQVVKTYDLNPKKKFITWSGLNNQNQKVVSGIYFYAIQNQKQATKMKKMLLLK